MKLYDSPVSGNCYKVRLLLSHLGLDYERVEVDVMDRGERLERLRDRNPTGKVPILELDDGRHLGESNAILFHLAQGSALLSDDPFERARTLQWMFFEQNNLEPNLGVATFIVTLLGKAEDNPEVLAHLHAGGNKALQVLERRVRDHEFVMQGYSIADIALFAYTHLAGRGGFDLAAYPGVLGWIERVRARPGFVPMLP